MFDILFLKYSSTFLLLESLNAHDQFWLTTERENRNKLNKRSQGKVLFSWRYMAIVFFIPIHCDFTCMKIYTELWNYLWVICLIKEKTLFATSLKYVSDLDKQKYHFRNILALTLSLLHEYSQIITMFPQKWRKTVKNCYFQSNSGTLLLLKLNRNK